MYNNNLERVLSLSKDNNQMNNGMILNFYIYIIKLVLKSNVHFLKNILKIFALFITRF